MSLCSLTETFAQTTYYSRGGGGNWNTAGTWSTTSHLGASCACVPASGNNTVQIAAGATVTYSSGSPAAISITTLTVNGSLVFGSGGAATNLTVTGDITIAALTGSLTSGVNSANAHTITLGGNLINNGTFNQTANSATNQTITFNSTATRAIRGSAATTSFNNMNVNGTGALSFGDNAALTPRTLNVANDLTIAAGATLQSGNTGTNAHVINLSGSLINNGTINMTANAPTNQTMTFSGAAAESIRGTATTAFTFYNVNVNGAGVLSFGDNTATSRTMTITNDLTVAAVGTLQSGNTAAVAHTIVLSGNLVNNGSVNFTANAASNHSITFNSAAAESIRGSASTTTFNNMNVNGTGALSFGDNSNARTLSVVNDLTIATGATLQSGNTAAIAHNLQIAGSLINNGTINMNASSPTNQTVTFTNTALESIRGTATTTYTFYNLDINGTDAVSIGNNTNARTMTIANDLTIGATATFQSGATGALAHSLVLSGSLINNGTIDLTANAATAHTITFNGGAAESIRGTGTGFNFNIVNVNGTGALSFGDNTATSRTINISGDLTIGTGATFQSGSSGAVAQTIQLTGNLINNGTVNFAANSATNHTIVFNSSATRTIIGTATTTYGLYNATVTNGGVLNFGDNANTRTLTVSGDLTIASASVVQSGTTAAIAHSLNLKGNLTNDGTLNLTANSATNHTLIFSSSVDETLSGSGSNTFTNVTLQTGSSAKVNVNTSILVNGVLNFAADGVFAIGSSANMTLGQAASITGFTAARYIQLDGGTGSNGNLIKTSNGTTASWQTTYPIGTVTGGYSRLVLTAVAGTAPTAGSTISIKAIYNNSIQGQLRRTFRIVVAGNAAGTTFTSPQFYFNSSTDVSGGDALANYTNIWHLNASSGSWASTTTGTVPGSTFFGPTTPTHNLITGTYYYTTGSSTAYPNTWYTYQSGVWSDWRNWTLDPSGTTLVNGLNLPPQPGDEIVILSGITITNDVSGQVASSTRIDENAVLDMEATVNNTLGVVSGTGLLRLQGVGLPVGDYNTSFVTSSGGTIEYYNTGGTLSTTQTTYNKLILSNSTASGITFITASNLTTNGNLEITQTGGAGTVTWQINNATDAQRTITLNNDLNVGAGGRIRVGTGNEGSTNPHALTIYGNIINNGSIKFYDDTDSELAESDYGLTYPTVGIDLHRNEMQGNAVTVTFSGTSNKTVTCSGTTDFYRLVLNKGTGQQAVLTVNSSSTANFRLFGPSNRATVETGNSWEYVSSNALSIVNGTLELTGSINIPVLQLDLSTAGYFPIPRNGALWLNGSNVTVQITDNSPAIFTSVKDGRILMSGLLRITAGTLNDGFSKGLGSQDGGTYLQEGGTVNCWQFRPRATGTGIFSFIQTGGVMNVGYGYALSGGKIDQYEEDYCRFDLNSPNSTFQMSGTAVLNVAKPTNTNDGNGGLFYIGSSSQNYNVTGGTINLYTGPETAGNAYAGYVNTTAPVYNLNIYEVAATTQNVELQTNGLVVLNNISINNGNTPSLITNGLNVTVGGNFNIQNGTTYTPGTGTTTFNGSGAQAWTLDGAITSLSDVVVNKSAGTLTLGGSQVFPNITGATVGLMLTSGTLNDNGKTLTVTGALSNSATHTGSGSITLSRTAANETTTLGGVNGTFGNLIITTTGTTFTASTAGQQTITGNLQLNGPAAASSTILNIGSNGLTVLGSITSNIALGANYRIQTAGLRNDAGLTRQIPAGAATDVLFPFGTTGVAAYSPMTIRIASTSGGTVTSRPVTGAHPNATPALQSLQYFWRVTNSTFTGVTSVLHKLYDYGSATLLQGTTATYKPVRYNPANFTWTVGTSYNATGLTVIPDFSFPTNIIDGEYTTGNLTAGVVKTYYSRQSGAWNVNTTWSTTPCTGAGVCGTAVTVGDFPGSNSPVVIGDNNNGHTVTIDADSRAAGSLFISPTSVLDCSTRVSLNFGVNTSGTGTLRIGSANFPAGDFNNFIGPAGGTVEWYGAFNIPTIRTYYNLITNASGTMNLPDLDITIYGNFTKTGAGTLQTNTANTRTIAVNGNLTVSAGSLNFQTGATTNFTVNGNTSIASGATLGVSGTTARTHTFTTTGSITNNGTLLFRNTAHVVNLVFTGSSNTSFTGSALATTLNVLTVDKGTSQLPTVTFDVTGTMSTLTNGWLNLLNGTFEFRNTGSYTLSSGNYSIPSTSRLKVSAGTVDIVGNVNIDAADLLLAGTLEVAGGTVNINPNTPTDRNRNNDIEYAATGTPTIIVSSGALNVNGAIRRSTQTLTGALVYNQTNGIVTVNGRNCSANATRGVFEIENNAGSSFTFADGTLNIRRSTGGTSTADLYINPKTSSVSAASTITMGMNANTPNVSGTLTINVVPAAGNVSLLNASTAQIFSMKSSSLTTLGTLTVNTNSTLRTNALDVNIGGNLTITGSYDGTISGGNTTTFNGTGPQTGDLTLGSSFQNITVNKSSGTATLNGTTSINNLNILNGDLSVSGTLNINGNIVNNSTQSGAGTINFEGTAGSVTHSITSSNGVFQNLSLGGPANIKRITVTGDMTINGTLNFTTQGTSRYLYIQSNKLTFGINAIINNAGTTRFIRTNGVASDLGVSRIWKTGGATSFTYPVGTRTNYTPSVVNLTVSSEGALTVVPVDDQHPTANAIGQQILNYYWIVTRGTGLVYSNTGTHSYQFPTGFIGGSGGTLIAAHLDALKLVGWTPSPGNGGSFANAGATTTMTFTNLLNTNLPGTGILSTDSQTEFHYTAGTSTTLPSPITPVYSRIENASTVGNLNVGGDWTLASNWTTSPTGIGGTIQSVIPSGRPIEIIPGSRINMDASGLRAFATRINGLVVLPSNTSGHNLGSLSGTGTLRTSNSTLPAGNYTTFVASGGGTIEYVAPMNINNLRTTYNNLSVSGTGALNMAIDITLNGNLTIGSGTTLNNSSANQDISIAGNWINNGTFLAGTGEVTFSGAVPTQSVTGITTFNNVTLSKSGNVTLGGSTTVNGILTLTSGNIAATTTYPLIFGPLATFTGGSASSFVSGPARRSIALGEAFTYPLGSTQNGQFRPATIFDTNGADAWTVEYVGHGPMSDGYSHRDVNTAELGRSSQFEYWNISRVGSTAASLTLTYNTGSYVPPNIGNLANLRVSHWDGSKWDLPTGGGTFSQSGTNISGSVTVTNVTSFSPFTLGSLDSDSPLPVTWVSFTANRVDNSVVLNWKTAQEHNNDHFEIERSADGKVFSSIGSRAAVGNSATAQWYEFVDKEVSLSSAYYYRIRQVDVDGKSDYSKIVMVTGNGVAKRRWIAMPNPVNDQSKFHIDMIDFSVEADLPVSIQLISSNGVIVFEGTGSLQDLNHLLQKKIEGLGVGVYLIFIADDTMREHFRIVRN